MTKEETAYAATLNLLGTGVVLDPDSIKDEPLRRTLGNLRYEALASVMPPGPKVRCPRCAVPFAYGGPTDGEHFADLWEHLITQHRFDPRAAEDPARIAWKHPLFDGAMAA
jgi:hypothetical protein